MQAPMTERTPSYARHAAQLAGLEAALADRYTIIREIGRCVVSSSAI